MREIKFRAWDKTNKRSIDLKNSAIDPLSGEIIGAHDPDEFYLFDSCDYDLMQYTSLKDKNGKEIYEGDIVNGAGEYCVEKKPVIWSRSGWYAGYEDKEKTNITSLCALDDIEVIGNIYENPEYINNQ
ncbi:MAG: hypothetical protein HPY65_17570 [Syntrophaceae bacterium]|nr:hypothetical protein [Syntrophaceae bacterium]